MNLRVGIIGLGVMGADHAKILYLKNANASITAIYDKDLKHANKISKIIGDAEVKKTPYEVIKSKNVDAILIASPDYTHAEFTLASIEQRKPVLCEKPLSPKLKECKKIIDAEIKLGKSLVQVGFMRRFDPAYNEMKNNLNSKKFGKPLLLHCIHRCQSPPIFFNSEMSITNALVHEFDISRWLLNSEIRELQIIKSNVRKDLSFVDPLLAIIKCTNDVIIDVEINQNANYGYDVRAELLCEKGSILMSPPRNNELMKSSKHTFDYPKDWRPRFADAYRDQNQSWINSILNNDNIQGASAWDGMMATKIAEVGIKSFNNNKSIPIPLLQTPKLYKKK